MRASGVSDWLESDKCVSCVSLQLMKILIKVSDISNEARPMDVAEPWLDCLLQEFFRQVIWKSLCKLEAFYKKVVESCFSIYI